MRLRGLVSAVVMSIPKKLGVAIIFKSSVNEPLRQRSSWPVDFSFWVLLGFVGCLLTIGLSAAQTVGLLTAVAVVSACGDLAIRLSGFSRMSFGLCFVVGTAVHVFVSQGFIALGIEPWFAQVSTLSAMGVLVVVSYISHQERWSDTSKSFLPNDFEIVTCIMTLTLVHFWLFPLTLAMSLSLLRWVRICRRQLVLARSLMLIVGALGALSLRPDKWWYRSIGTDSGFFEALSWSLARFGPGTHPGLKDGSIALYHWFSYAANGSISELLHLAPWVGLSGLSPALLALCTASVIFELTRPCDNKQDVPFMLLVAIATTVIVGAVFVSFVYSLLVGLSLLSLSRELEIASSPFRTIPLFTLLSAMLYLSKTTTSVPVIALLGVQIAVLLWKRARLSRLVIPFLITTATAAAGIAVNRDSGNLSGLADNTLKLRFDVFAIMDYSIYLLLGDLLLVVVGMTFFASHTATRRPQHEPLFLAMIIVAPLGFVWILLSPSTYTYYLGGPLVEYAKSIGLIACVVNYSKLRDHPLALQNSDFSLITLGALIAFCQREILRLQVIDIESFLNEVGSSIANTFPPIVFGKVATPENIARFQSDFVEHVSELLAGPALMLVSLIILRMFSRKSAWIQNYSLGLSALLLVAGNITGSSMHRYREFALRNPASYEYAVNNDTVAPTSDLVAMGRWIRASTEESDLLASNHFCCSGSDWWLPDKRGWPWGGSNFHLPAETQRLFLIQGPRFRISPSGRLTDDQIAKVQVSLDFANYPSMKSLQKLRDYGVVGFVVNLTLTDNRSWSSFATERFQMGSFLYLELN